MGLDRFDQFQVGFGEEFGKVGGRNLLVAEVAVVQVQVQDPATAKSLYQYLR
jgi:hypothetical protein